MGFSLGPLGVIGQEIHAMQLRKGHLLTSGHRYFQKAGAGQPPNAMWAVCTFRIHTWALTIPCERRRNRQSWKHADCCKGPEKGEVVGVWAEAVDGMHEWGLASKLGSESDVPGLGENGITYAPAGRTQCTLTDHIGPRLLIHTESLE